jgi:hypothetical protein
VPDFEDEFENDETDEREELFEQYKEEQDALNDSGSFEDTYGFPHECRCAIDWSEGNLGVVSICYLEMCNDALDALAATRQELGATKSELAELKLANI